MSTRQRSVHLVRVLPGALADAAQMDAAVPSPRAGWRTLDELADAAHGPDWRYADTRGAVLRNLEDALVLLAADGAAEWRCFNGWIWWRCPA